MSVLKKTLGLADLTLFGLASILGSGGFNLIGDAVGAGGAWWPGSLAVSAAVLGGASWSYTRAFSVTGGSATSESDIIKKMFGFETPTVITILFWNIVSIAVILVLCSSLLFPQSGWGTQVGFSLALLGAMTAFSLAGIETNSKAIDWMTWAMLVFLTAAAGIGGWAALNGREIMRNKTAPSEFSFSKSVMFFFFVLAGFDVLIKFAAETQDAAFAIPASFFLSNGISDIIVFGIAAAISAFVAGTSGHSALPNLFGKFFGPSVCAAVCFAIILFMLVTTFVVFLSTTRYLFGIGEKHKELDWLTTLNNFKAPVNASLVVGVLTAGFLLLNNLDILIDIANVFLVGLLAMVTLSVLKIDWLDKWWASVIIEVGTLVGLGGLLREAVIELMGSI